MLAHALYLLLAGYVLFLLGFALFMYFENRKFGDNQFTMKLLPPPPRLQVPAPHAAVPASDTAPAARASEKAPAADWSPVSAPAPAPAFRGEASGARLARAA